VSDQPAPEDRPSRDDHRARGWAGRGSPARFTFLLVFAIVIAAIAFTGESLGHHGGATTATITVTGSGTVTGAPNTMAFQVGVQSTAGSAVNALDENNVKMAALESSLLKSGIAKKNLQTSGLDIYENTNSNGDVTGFTAVDDLNVTTHDISHAGQAIDAAAHSVGNGIQLSGVTFSISNQSKLLAAARARAIRNAHVEATQVAKGGGTTLGDIVKVTDEENTGSTGIVVPYASFAAAAAKNVPIQAGTQSVNVQVEVVYALAS